MSTLPLLDVSVPVTERKPSTSNSFLTAAEKKAHHIASEKKRREQIRTAFDEIVQVVPDLTPQEARSELLILTKSASYIERLRQENERLREAHHAQRGPITNEQVVDRIKNRGGFLGADLMVKEESASP